MAWLKAITYGAGIVGFGYALMKFTTPTEEQLVAKLSPELKEKYYANKAKNDSVIGARIRDAAERKDAIWLKNPEDVLNTPIKKEK